MHVLDLCCGEGGAGEGYARAGFDVTGVDTYPMPRNPHRFVQGDAFEIGARLLTTGQFDLIHISPPCPRYSRVTPPRIRHTHVDLITRARKFCTSSGLPYVIENVPGAPLLNPQTLCGCMFPELNVYRPRLFETSFAWTPPRHKLHDRPVHYQYDKRKGSYGVPFNPVIHVAPVHGSNNVPVRYQRAAMGTPWMSRQGVVQAIPPAFTEYIAHQFLVERLG